MTRPASAYLACTSFIDDEIEADWVNDEEDIKAMRVVLASKFSDDNPAFRDLLLATGDKDLYVQGFATTKDDKIWELGAHEPDVTTSGLGLYGDLLMERRAELREGRTYSLAV